MYFSRIRRKLAYLKARVELYLCPFEVVKITNKDLLIYLSKVVDPTLARALVCNPHLPKEALENMFEVSGKHFSPFFDIAIVDHPNATELLRRRYKLRFNTYLKSLPNLFP